MSAMSVESRFLGEGLDSLAVEIDSFTVTGQIPEAPTCPDQGLDVIRSGFERHPRLGQETLLLPAKGLRKQNPIQSFVRAFRKEARKAFDFCRDRRIL
jgi:hypothetical protein